MVTCFSESHLWKHTTVNYFYLTHVFEIMRPQALVVMILLSLTPMATTQISNLPEEVDISQSSGNTIVQQFGTGFDETVIASTNDGLNVPGA